MPERLSATTEDYLKLIYELSAETGLATTSLIAERLGIAPASVTGMLQRLAAAEPPLVIYHRHHGVELTPEGRQAALETIRHHRLLELFLQRTLGYTWDEVHAEADRLEHVISEQFEERMARALGDPSYDPHGEPIPNRDLSLPENPSLRLGDLRPGQAARIEWVTSSDAGLLRYLAENGLYPGTPVTVVDYSPYDEILRLAIQGKPEPVVLGANITRQVFVSLIERGVMSK
jgi:DtxR family Mn-dependent transcriptional regulator